jgi:rRNA-processing protein FCF1
MKILLDTNFLMGVAQFKIDIFRELKGHELSTLNGVIRELRKHAEGEGKRAQAAEFALKLVKSKGLKVLYSKEKDTDKAIAGYARKGYAVATQDRLLRTKSKKVGATVIYIRQKRYLVVE